MPQKIPSQHQQQQQPVFKPQPTKSAPYQPYYMRQPTAESASVQGGGGGKGGVSQSHARSQGKSKSSSSIGTGSSSVFAPRKPNYNPVIGPESKTGKYKWMCEHTFGTYMYMYMYVLMCSSQESKITEESLIEDTLGNLMTDNTDYCPISMYMLTWVQNYFWNRKPPSLFLLSQVDISVIKRFHCSTNYFCCTCTMYMHSTFERGTRTCTVLVA